MARKRKVKKESTQVKDAISGYMSRLKLKDLKRACVIRGIPFQRIPRYGVHDLQSWLFRNFNNRINPTLLEDYDAWFDNQIEDSPIHLLLRLAYYAEDEDGNVKQERRNTMMLGVEKTKIEVATFRPKRGSMKAMVFQMIRDGNNTKEIIAEIMDLYPAAKEGSIKSWASKARKAKRYQEELDNEI